MNQIELSIPDMQSAHCQTRVNNAVKEIQGVQIEKIESGKLTASVENGEVKDKLVKAIELAGYKVGDDNKAPSSCSTGCCGS